MSHASLLSRLWLSLGLLTGCAVADVTEGRFILYLEPATAAKAQTADAQADLLDRWRQALDGQIRLERILATGGWVVTVVSSGDAAAQAEAVERLPGVEEAEPDAVLRHY